ncbi:MAG: hypothetical protein M3137_03500 [Actinomycetota bacterium]|nr:hypothetical protein [Actinomycetota bacterium]
MDDEGPPRRTLVVSGMVSFTVLLGMWIALVGTFDVQDLVAGVGAAAISVGVGYLVGQRGRALPSLRRGDLARFAGLVPNTISESLAVYVMTIRRVRGRGTPGRFRTVPTDATGEGWRGARRNAVVGALLSATPTVVVSVEPGTGTATVHEFVASDGRADG